MAHRPPAVRISAPTASTSRLAAPPVLASSAAAQPRAAPRKSRKGKERDEGPPPDDSEPPRTSREGPKQKRRRKMKAAAAEDSDTGARRSSADESEYDGDAGEDNDEDDDNDGDDLDGRFGPPEPDDWADPRTLPPSATGKTRVRAQLRALELGTYRSALLDTVNGEMDLGAALFGLERLRKSTRADEDRVRDARGHVRDGKGARKRRKSATGSTSSTGNDEPDERGAQAAAATHETASRDGDSDDPSLPSYPHPSAAYLAKFTHWPLHPSILASLPTAPSLPEAFASVFATISHRLAPPHPHRNMKQRPRSAYALSAPLYFTPRAAVAPPARLTRSTSSRSPSPAHSSPPPSSSGSSSLFEDSDDLDSSLDDPEPPAELLERVGALVDGVLDRVADAIELGPFPPLDYWDAKARKSSEREAERERRKRRRRDGRAPVAVGIGEDEAPGWETVLLAVRERDDVPAMVADLLQERLEALYGPPRADAPILPPPHNGTPIRTGLRPTRRRTASAKPTSTPAPRTRSRSRSSSAAFTDLDEDVEMSGDGTLRPRKRKASEELPRAAKGKGRAARIPSFRASRSTTPAESPLVGSSSLDDSFLDFLLPIPADLPPLPPDFEPVVYDPVLAHLGPVPALAPDGADWPSKMEGLVPIDPALL